MKTNVFDVGMKHLLPYSGKFLRGIIFAFFVDWSGTAKIRLCKFFLFVKHTRISLERENCFREKLLIAQSMKIVYLKNLVLNCTGTVYIL